MVQQVGKYVLESELGKGAMGSVWLSRHPGLNIPVAVKILDPALAAEDPDYMDRFIKEGKIAASINHQNIVRIIDAGQEGQIFYLVMEYIEGADAKQLVEHRGALPVSEVLELAICTADALSQAHKAGIVHRDIKPDNILVTTNGNVKLADLGIAKQLNDDFGSTMSGTTIGTPYYIAPEQAMDSSTVDTRCDIYAFGGTLYHLLTGTVPFTGPSAMAILMKHTKEELQHPKERRADLPNNICDVVCKMMEKHPDNRYQNCEELLKDLYDVKSSKSSSSSKKKRHFKAPSKKKLTVPNMDKEVANIKPVAKSVKKKTSKKRKKDSKIPIIAALITIIVILTGFFIFMPEASHSQVKNQETPDKPDKPARLETITDSLEPDIPENYEPNKPGTIKIINKPFPYRMDKVNSKKLGWKKSWALFAEFKGDEGAIISKSFTNKWTADAKALYIGSDGYLLYSVGNEVFNTGIRVNDGKYHRVILQCQNGIVTCYVDGLKVGSQNLWAKDYNNSVVNIGTSIITGSSIFKGEIMRVAFWNDPYPESKFDELKNGKFKVDKTAFYYENNFKPFKTPSTKVPEDISTQIIEDIERDNPGLELEKFRVTIKQNALRVNLSDTQVKNISSLAKYPIKFLNLASTKVEDFSPLKEIPIFELDISMIKQRIDLNDLNHKTLRRLRLIQGRVKDTKEFKKFNLHYLAIRQHAAVTSFIKHMNLYRLDMDNAKHQINFNNLNKDSLRELRVHFAKGVSSISDLKGFKLKTFHLTDSSCTDLSALKEMPLEDVAIIGTKVKDISFMENAPVKHLILNDSCENVEVIKSLKKLKNIAIPGTLWGPEIEFLRSTNVKIEGVRDKDKHWWLYHGVLKKLDSKKFWEDYDEYIKSKNK